jgi:diguanylate cyclase (GGDEF)-like protein
LLSLEGLSGILRPLAIHQRSAESPRSVDNGRRLSRSLPAGARLKVRAAARADLAARLKQKLRTLRARAERRETIIEAVRGANATVDPAKVADWIVQNASTWLPAPCWALVAPDATESAAVLADHGLVPGVDASVFGAAMWVLKNGRELFSADLSKDSRVNGPVGGSVIAFPLISRGKTVGALVGLDPLPSASMPALSGGSLTALRVLFEPQAIALDNAIVVQRAESLSVTDDLTRLYNSRYMNQVLRREAKRASRSGRPVSVLFIDLDGFKQVNDSHGHLCGSRALVEAAEVIRGCARETDVVARFGGDEFSLILPDTGRDGAVSVAVRIRERVAEHVFLQADGLNVRLTASVGVATLPDVAGSAEELIRAADMAMYKVKDAGKNGIHVAHEEVEGRR